MDIQLAEPADVDAVELLDRRATELRTFYRDRHDRFDRRLWCAKLDGSVVGMALVGPPLDNFGPWVGQLHQLEVHPAHRGRGIGARLHETCVESWRASGVTVGVLEVLSRNVSAVSFFESHGWRPDGHTRVGRGDVSYLRLRRAVS